MAKQLKKKPNLLSLNFILVYKSDIYTTRIPFYANCQKRIQKFYFNLNFERKNKYFGAKIFNEKLHSALNKQNVYFFPHCIYIFFERL